MTEKKDDTGRYSPFEDASVSQDAISTSFALVDAADGYVDIAEELELAAQHCRRAAEHFIGGRIPRGCAHGFAAEGHIKKASKILDGLAILHAERSAPDHRGE